MLGEVTADQYGAMAKELTEQGLDPAIVKLAAIVDRLSENGGYLHVVARQRLEQMLINDSQRYVKESGVPLTESLSMRFVSSPPPPFPSEH